MGMGKKSAPAPAPAQEPVAAPTVENKDIIDAQSDDNLAANKAARAEENQSATLLQIKDDEELKKQAMMG